MTSRDEAIVRVEDAFVAFPSPAGTVMALRGADLSVDPGERLLVQGPNGSGKSTLLRVITGEQAVVAGRVQVGGTALQELGVAQRRRWRAAHVGFIDQHPLRSLLAEQAVQDNVALQLRLSGLSSARARRQAAAILVELGLAELADRRVAGLSGGEAQRVAIAAAVIHRPRLVLADEPTGELDEHSARGVYDLLTAIAGQGTSVILVSHDPRSDAFADRAVRIRDGRVAEQWTSGTAAEEQVPDSRGWIRVPAELLPELPRRGGLVATRQADGLLLRPGSRGRSAGRGAQPSEQVAWGKPFAATTGRRWSAPPAVGSYLAIADLTAGYGRRAVIAGLTLHLGPHDVVVVTGASGTGKSTLLSVAAGLVDPMSGRVHVGGRDGRQLDRSTRAELRRAWLAVAPQRPSLVEALTVRENLELTLALRSAAEPVTVGVAAADVAEVADRLGLSPLLDRAVHQLSGGERQRAAVGRAVVSRAPLMVLDEPTSQQDEGSALQVVRVLREEAAAGRAVLVATHDARLIEVATARVALGAAEADGFGG
ncbi:MAG TPA: ATP-binding cassette domain-containing protein [Propionibacteriaceae bacterium]|nr:ATP-binding cassette domain-containing protein [Propionibacteriaceae bacterium]